MRSGIIRHTFHQVRTRARMKRHTRIGRRVMNVSFMSISSTDGTHMLLDNNYHKTVANGNFNIGNVKLAPTKSQTRSIQPVTVQSGA
jgi:hypothetical protein